MKPVRVLLIAGGVLLVVALVAVAAALNSGVQTWGARKALAGQPGLKATLGAVSAGLQRVKVTDLRVESGGAILTLPSLEAELPVVTAAVSKRAEVRSLRARGWTLDLTHAAGAGVTPANPEVAAAAAAPLFQGAIARIELPVGVTIADVDLAGEVLMPGLPGHPPARIKVTLRGGGLGVGRDGKFGFDLTGATEDGGALTLHGDIVAAMDTPQTFGRFSVATTAAVSGPRFPQGVKLDAQLAAARTAGGETYQLTLAGNGKNLADIQANFTTAGAKLAGRWKLDLRDTDLAPFALGRELPAFTAAGEGSFETDASFAEVHAAGRLQVSADRLQVIRPELGAMGAVTVAADFDLLQHGDSVRVERLNASLAGAKPVLNAHALQAFEFNVRTGALSLADPAQDLLWLSLQGVPLAWVRPFTGDLAVTGGDLRGEVAASAQGGGLALHSKSPLAVSQLGIARAGTPLLRGVDLTAGFAADYAPQGWQVSVTDFATQAGGAPLLSLELKAGRLAGKDQPVKATGKWSLNLPTALAQPVCAAPLQLASGTAAGDFTASITPEAQQIQAKVTLTNLVAATKEALPAVSAELRADVDRAGKVTFNLPLLFERAGRKSDLLVAGTVAASPAGLALDARVASDLLVLDDVKLLGAPAAAGTPAAPVGPVAGPDPLPFWQGLSGQVSLTLKQVVYTDQFKISNVTGTLRVGEGAVKLEGLQAAFGTDSDLKLDAGVTFTPKTPAPYALAADLSVLNFDAAPAFRAVAPAKLPTIEGRINVTSHIAGGGRNLGDLADRAHGDFELTSKAGLFRVLNSDISDKVQKTQSTVAAIGSFLGSMTGKKESDNPVNKGQKLVEITKALSEIPFDQLSVTATRDPSLNLVLKDFTLISPEVRIGGTGQVSYVAGTPLLEQPLKLELTLATRGKLGDKMKGAGLLDTKTDNLGYSPFIIPFRIGGTLAATDTSDLSKAFLNSLLEKPGLLDSLFGK
ncbi:MAG: hypothetical protein JSS11_15720 [Verrucomicrobia bacterium]|nr:hypothetical protein [Verrucomicrobiota bacterium]